MLRRSENRSPMHARLGQKPTSARVLAVDGRVFPYREAFVIFAAVLLGLLVLSDARAQERPSGDKPVAAPEPAKADSEAKAAAAAEDASKASDTGSEAVAPEAGSKKDTASSKKDEAGASTRRASSRKAPPGVQELEALVIEGRIQKPEVFYVIGRADAEFESQRRRKGFVDRIVKSVEDNPF